jgi:hypothetical protein
MDETNNLTHQLQKTLILLPNALASTRTQETLCLEGSAKCKTGNKMNKGRGHPKRFICCVKRIMHDSTQTITRNPGGIKPKP